MTEEIDVRLANGAAWYATFGWKVLAVHGINSNGKCTCGLAHTDVKEIGKHPATANGQNDATSDPTLAGGWWRENPLYNIGIHAKESGFMVIDIDPRSEGFESFEKFEQLVEGNLPPTVEAITGVYTVRGRKVRGRHLYYKVDAIEDLKGHLKAEGLPGIDIKHKGYVLAAPSKHFSGIQYEWKPGHAPWEMEMATAPEELIAPLRKKQGRYGGGGSGKDGRGLNAGAAGWSWIDDLTWNGEKLDLEKFQNEGISEGSRAVDIYAMACALANKYGTDPMNRKNIETMMLRFNHEMVKPPMEVDGANSLLMHVNRALDFVDANPKMGVMGAMGQSAAAWDQKKKEGFEKAKSWAQGKIDEINTDVAKARFERPDPDDEDSIVVGPESVPGTIGYDVESVIYGGGSIASAAAQIDVPGDRDALTPEEGGDPRKRSLTDTGNGRRFVDAFGGGVRYTPGLGWFNWNGNYWRPDQENLETRELAKRVSAAIASEVSEYEEAKEKEEVTKWANQAKSNARLTATLDSATSDPRIAVDVDRWDNNPTLIGVQNGVVDLRTGELLKGRPDLHITRRAPVSYLPGAVNSQLADFLDFATGGDKEYQEWLQKAVGYTLTGLRTLDVMFLVYGPGGTGKSTFVESIVKCLGTTQYVFPLDSGILAQNDGKAQASDMYHWAELRGKRMIWVEELPESERLKENSIKKLTGSSEISARSPGEKPFVFQSQGKLWITTNHRPIITDDAMWRRIRPIPWIHVPEVENPGLREFLLDPEGGRPAVFAWAVEGAMKFINSKDADPLGTCAVVKEATETYRQNEDRFGLFLSEETVEVAGAELPVSALYSAYRIWSEARSERAMTRIAFDRKLTDRALGVKGSSARAVLSGYSLTPSAPGGGDGSIDWTAVTRWA